MPSRRQLLMSAAATTAGTTGLVFGSGAFTSVETTRDYGLSIAPDDGAQLAIEPGDGATGLISDSGDFRQSW